MGPEHWRQVEELYHATLEKTPADRAGFLAQASEGDEELRREVESLLAQRSSRGAVLEQPAWHGDAAFPDTKNADGLLARHTGSGRTGSMRCSARAAWAGSTKPSTRGWTGRLP